MQAGLSHGSQGSAFTLIELMVVCVLIAILTAMILPEMRGTYNDALLRGTGRKLVNAFSLAYSRAVSLNQLTRVRIDTRTGRFFVERRTRENGQQLFAPLRDMPGGEGELDSRISIEIRNPIQDASTPSGQAATTDALLMDSSGPQPIDAISFYPDGTADGREVVLRDRDGFRLALRINPITARVQIADLGRESSTRIGGMAP